MFSAVAGLPGVDRGGESIPAPPRRRCPCRLLRAEPPRGPSSARRNLGNSRGEDGAGGPRACRLLSPSSRCPRAGLAAPRRAEAWGEEVGAGDGFRTRAEPAWEGG